MLVVYEVDGDVIVLEEDQEELFKEESFKRNIHLTEGDYKRTTYDKPVFIQTNMRVKKF